MKTELNEIIATDAYMQGIFIHEIFAYLFFVPYVWYLYNFYTYKTFLELNKKVYFVMPITICVLSISIVTGIFLLAMRGFVFDIRIVLMMIVLIIFLIGEICRIKSLKRSKTSIINMQRYVDTFKKMYIAFLLLYIVIIYFLKFY